LREAVRQLADAAFSGTKMPIFDPSFAKMASKTYSQNNEDGIVSHIMMQLGVAIGFFVEFGVGPPWKSSIEESGLEANCRLLREMGWRGIFMDSSPYPPQYEVQREYITALNINLLLRKYEVPQEPEIISIDVDGQDFWIWMNLIYRPKVVVVEYNPNFGPEESIVIPFNVEYRWDGTKWYGASLRALEKLGHSKGYLLTYATRANAFFIKKDLVENASDFRFSAIHQFHNIHRPDDGERPWVVI
jgi:hypothetical protein